MGSSGKTGGTKSPLTTKGDVWGYSTVDARVPVGADTLVLTADSTQAPGVKWAATAQASTINEVQAGVLLNATSTGDAGGRADHFTGSSLAAVWTVHNGTAVVGNSSLGLGGGTGQSATRPYTPSGAFTLEARMNPTQMLAQADTVQFGAANDTANNNAVVITFSQQNTNNFTLGTYDTNGTFTSRTTSQPFLRPPAGWWYFRLHNDGANNWTAFWSQDRANWVSFGAGTAKTMVVNFLILITGTGSSTSYGLFDFIDVTA